jgi:3',5'-cyclic-nucleotide phosphodiesterase
MEEYSTLQADLSAVTDKWKEFCEEKGLDPNVDDPDIPTQPDFSKPLGRRGAPMDCRKYDSHLICLIKSKFNPAENEAAVRDVDLEKKENNWLRVLRPFTQSQYEEHIKVLPDNAQRLVMSIIDKIDQWDFDVWTLQDHLDKGSLFYTAFAIFCQWDFFRIFNINEQVALNFFTQVEAGYHACPYHNSMHGADVCHITQYILKRGGLKETAELTDEDCFASIIAGMIHDYDHPGLNNNFHVKIQSYLATLYNDRAILENHHVAEIFDMVKDPNFDIFGDFSDEQRRDIRETIIEMVTGTDMGLHAKIFGAWKRRIKQDHDLHKKKDTQRQALVMAIKMADISNCGRPTFLYLKWGMKLIEEFFMQGDNERYRGDPISPFMDRAAPSMSKSQIAFMNFVVVPMYESIAEYLPDMHFSVDHAEENKQYWNENDDSV